MAFRLRCKVFEKEGRTWLVTHCLTTTEQGDRVKAFLLSDDDYRLVALSIDDYNALPYHWFEDQGEAPKAMAVRPTVI